MPLREAILTVPFLDKSRSSFPARAFSAYSISQKIVLTNHICEAVYTEDVLKHSHKITEQTFTDSTVVWRTERNQPPLNALMSGHVDRVPFFNKSWSSFSARAFSACSTRQKLVHKPLICESACAEDGKKHTRKNTEQPLPDSTLVWRTGLTELLNAVMSGHVDHVLFTLN